MASDRRKTNFDDSKPKIHTNITQLIKMDQHLKKSSTPLKKLYKYRNRTKKSLIILEKTENGTGLTCRKKIKIFLEGLLIGCSINHFRFAVL